MDITRDAVVEYRERPSLGQHHRTGKVWSDVPGEMVGSSGAAREGPARDHVYEHLGTKNSSRWTGRTTIGIHQKQFLCLLPMRTISVGCSRGEQRMRLLI